MTQSNLMFDIETTGARPGCKVLAIGVVPFSSQGENLDILGGRKCFYDKIFAGSYGPDYHSSLDTMQWWDKQPADVRSEAWAGTRYVPEVLHDLARYCDGFGPDVLVWGNGATFDISILEYLFINNSIQIPWNFRNIRCFRTLKALFPAVGADIMPTVPHNALEDALAQARRAELILSMLSKLRGA